MRDNLVFVGIPESGANPDNPFPISVLDPVTEDSMEIASGGSASGQPPKSYASVSAAEDCAEKIFDFCAKILKIENPKSKIEIDRAHRMGGHKKEKVRSIVVKFKDTNSKLAVKAALRAANLRDTPYAVFDQYPQEVQDRRKALIPVMKSAREAGRRVYMVRDKLYIDNKQYVAGAH